MKYSRSEAKQWVRNSLRGHMIVATTPFKPDLEVDYEGLQRNVEQMIRTPGVTAGIYVGSVYQEFWTLTLDERKRVAGTILDAVAGRVPVLVGVSHTSYRDAIDLAKHAQAGGADLVMAWPPYYGPRSAEGMQAFFKRLADAVDIGVCTYSSTLSELGYYLTPEEVAKLAEIDTICAVKEASLSLDKYSAMMMEAGHLLAISSPLEEYHLYGLEAFGPEIMPKFLFGSSRPLYMQSAQKPHCATFMQALERGDLPAARKALQDILRVANQLHSKYLGKGQHNVSLTKYLSGLTGMATGPVRPPLSAPSAQEIAWATDILRKEGLLPSGA